MAKRLGMSKPVSKPGLRLRVSRGAASRERLQEAPGVHSVEERDEAWCLTITPAVADRGHLGGEAPSQGPVEEGREKVADALLALGLAGATVAAQETGWAVWVGGAAAVLTVLLPARREFEALLFAPQGGQRLRDLRRVLGVLALLALGVLDPEALFWLPLVFGLLLGAQGLLLQVQAPLWRLRWNGQEVSQDVTALRPGDLVALPAGVRCPTPCRLEQGEGSFVSIHQGRAQPLRLGQQVPMGAQLDSAAVLRVLEVPAGLRSALGERPQASLRLTQALRTLEAAAVVSGLAYLLLAHGTLEASGEPLLVVGLVWLAPLGVLHQSGERMVRTVIRRFWSSGLQLGEAAALDQWARVRRVVVLSSCLETDGWEPLCWNEEPDLPGWPSIRAALETGSSADPAVQVEPGLGVSAQLGPDTWIVGTPDFVGVDALPAAHDDRGGGSTLAVVRNGAVVCVGSAHRRLRSGARSGIAVLRATGLPLSLLGDDEHVTGLASRVGVPDPPVTPPAGLPQTWRHGGPPGATLWVAASWPQGAPAGPCVRLGAKGPGMLSETGLLGIAPALREARLLRFRLAGLASVGVLATVHLLAAGLCRDLTLPLLVFLWVWLGASLWLADPEGPLRGSGALRQARRRS